MNIMKYKNYVNKIIMKFPFNTYTFYVISIYRSLYVVINLYTYKNYYVLISRITNIFKLKTYFILNISILLR